jgi:hypothetical protein
MGHPMFNLDNIKTGVAIISGTIAAIGGGYTVFDKIFPPGDILTWAPEYFEISDGPVNGEFRAIVARTKHRDDCSVTNFTVEIRDADYIVYPATVTTSKFSGPASDNIDKFGFKFYFREMDVHQVTPGTATLIAQISYSCPEGDVFIAYPSHENLNFEVLEYIENEY